MLALALAGDTPFRPTLSTLTRTMVDWMMLLSFQSRLGAENLSALVSGGLGASGWDMGLGKPSTGMTTHE